jgi:hypothetical protein
LKNSFRTSKRTQHVSIRSPTFPRNILPPYSGLQPRTLVPVNKSTRRYNPKDQHRQNTFLRTLGTDSFIFSTQIKRIYNLSDQRKETRRICLVSMRIFTYSVESDETSEISLCGLHVAGVIVDTVG